jgi:hypothetical protein
MSRVHPRHVSCRLGLSLASVLLAALLVACGSDSPGEPTAGDEVGGGGAATGGTTSSGGGSPATGGADTSGGGRPGTGGTAPGGSGAGGANGGGAFPGGASSGGAATGGDEPGGAAAGGTAGASTGGSDPGGSGTGGTGGTSGTGGDEPGGAATGGTSTGGDEPGGTGGGETVLGQPRWLGRVDASDPGAVRFAWQGAGVVATVNGSEIAVTLRTEGTDTVFFQPVIDGVATERFEVPSGADHTVTLASDLPAADHVVALLRDTEGMYGVSTFLGFARGTVVGAPAPSGRLIEVVGDSISAGYGNLGSEPHRAGSRNPPATGRRRTPRTTRPTRPSPDAPSTPR